MAYEQKPGECSLFKNDQKRGDSDPDYKGDGAALDGTPVWVSAWINKKEGKKTFLKVVQKRKDAQQPARSAPKPPPAEDFDDSIPF
jgi:hypothetical protein